MMIEEFNLSDKQKEHDDGMYICYLHNDVKEAVKRLKENLGNDCTDCHNWNLKLIDKIFGDKLI